MPFVYRAKFLTPQVGDLAGPSYDKPEWLCVESGFPGKWVRVPIEPLDLDAIAARAKAATGVDTDAAFISADEDVPALIAEVRQLRRQLADAEQATREMGTPDGTS